MATLGAWLQGCPSGRTSSSCGRRRPGGRRPPSSPSPHASSCPWSSCNSSSHRTTQQTETGFCFLIVKLPRWNGYLFLVPLTKGTAERFRAPARPEEVVMSRLMERSAMEEICEARCLQRSGEEPPSCASSCLASSLTWPSSVTTSPPLPPLPSTTLAAIDRSTSSVRSLLLRRLRAGLDGRKEGRRVINSDGRLWEWCCETGGSAAGLRRCCCCWERRRGKWGRWVTGFVRE